MEIKTLVTFRAVGFPDESQWTASGSPLVPDGWSVSTAIASALRSIGYQVSEPVQHSFYGWSFTVTCSEHQERCLLQLGEPSWLLQVEEKLPAWRRLLGKEGSSDLLAVLRAVDEALKADPRFSVIRWFCQKDYEAGANGGAETPLAGDMGKL